MISFSLIITIALIDFISIITPGQDFAIVTRNTLKYSKKSGIMTAFGVGASTLLHCFMAMLSLSLILAQNENILGIIKTLGALYLIYLGTSFIKNAKNLKIDKNQQSNQKIKSFKCFKMGFITNILNIEPIVAFTSIFTIVLPPETLFSTKLIIAFLLPINTFLWLCFLTQIFSISTFQNFLKTRMKYLEKAIGTILIFFGSKTLISNHK